MKEISRTKKLETAQYYLLGHSYKDVEQETGVSHGTIANVVKEAETGKLDIPGTALDQINGLHQLALDLKKKGLSTSQAVHGLLFFTRISLFWRGEMSRGDVRGRAESESPAGHQVEVG